VAEWVAWQKTGQEKAKIERYLIMALERSGLCITVQNSDREYLYIANLFDQWAIDGQEEPDDVSLFGPAIAKRLRELKDAAVAEKNQKQAEIVIDEHNAFDFTVETVPAECDSHYLLTRIIDLSEKKTAERVTTSLLREVSHRSKNLLAIIQSLASQTARNSDTVAEFNDAFRGRLHALSRAQDLITDSNWRGAMVKDLLHEQVSRYMPDEERIIRFEGQNILLSPNISLHLGLALHELTIMATRTLDASKDGQIRVRCEHGEAEGQKVAELTWAMPDGPVGAPGGYFGGESDFSRVLLETVVPASMSGEAEYVKRDGELFYRIVFPL
jgi:two-component sensor histidine kinase